MEPRARRFLNSLVSKETVPAKTRKEDSRGNDHSDRRRTAQRSGAVPRGRNTEPVPLGIRRGRCGSEDSAGGIAVRGYERFSMMGNSRVGMSVTAIQDGPYVRIIGITMGGSQAVFFNSTPSVKRSS